MELSVTVLINCLLLLNIAVKHSTSAAVKEYTFPREGRIVGGWETSIAYFPHQVSLQILNNHICGGSLIDKDLVLTAAHCVARYAYPSIFTIRAGSSYISQGGIVARVKTIQIHEDYGKSGIVSNDIALLKLVQPLVYSSYIQPIIILEKSVEISDQEQLWVSGWGTLGNRDHQMSPILRYTTVKKMNIKLCQQSYKSITEVTTNMLCAGVEQGGRDSCQGDSGGPLIAQINNTTTLVGIVSFGNDCAKPGYPGVYTRVQNYHLWLNKTIEILK